jgi:hypothetical protein
MAFDIAQALSGASSLLQGVGVSPEQSTATQSPTVLTSPGQTAPAAVTLTGGAAPPTTSTGIPTIYLVGGGVLLLIIAVVALRARG